MIDKYKKLPVGPALILLTLFTCGCSTAYYNTMEKFGVHKRDILVDRVEEARDAQHESKEQFKSALDRFSKELGFEGGDLEQKYETLNDEYERSVDKAETVRDRIDKVEDVATALFDEWKDELKEYSSDSMRRASERKLNQTKKQYDKLIVAMRRAEQKMDPVLAAFKDQVLFLKHNLNAKAVASLQSELGNIKSDISRLIKEMDASIKEADRFINSMAEQ